MNWERRGDTKIMLIEWVIRKIACLSIAAIMLAGCAETITTQSELAESNNEKLSKLSVGMSKQQVIKFMVKKTYHFGGFNLLRGFNSPSLIIKNPYRSETILGKDGKTFEVIYYVVFIKGRSKTITENDLIPLVFDDNKLAGWGKDYLKKLE
jgi:hypothetical protein